VLTLTAWGEDEVSSRIDAEYRREIPRLYRAIERIDELGGRAAMQPAADYADHLPRVGRNISEMLAREHQSLDGFQLVLSELADALTAEEEEIGAAIARNALETRAAYLAWIASATAACVGHDSTQPIGRPEQRPQPDPNRNPAGNRAANNAPTPAPKSFSPKSNGDRSLAPPPPEAAAVWNCLLRLYVQLSPAIEETVVHMLLLRRAGQLEAARETWRDSWAYMLYAAEVVRLLARRGWAMDFRSPAALRDLAPPVVAATASQAIQSNQRRRETLANALVELVAALAESADAEAHSIADNAANYLRSRNRGEPGFPPREAPNFEAMLERESFKPL